VDDGKVDRAERLLHRGQLVQVVQHDVRDGVTLELDHDSHALPVRFVSKIRKAVDLLVVHQLRDPLDQLFLIDLVRNLGDDYGHSLAGAADPIDGGPGAHFYSAAARLVGLFDAVPSVNESTGGEVGTGQETHKRFQSRSRILKQID